MNELSVLVLGIGRWGQEWLNVLTDETEVVISATAGGQAPDLDKAPNKSSEYRHYLSYEEAIAASDADAVLITLPPRLHAEAIIRSIESGKHVLCEKPLVPTPADLTNVVKTLTAYPQLVVMAGQNYRRRSWAVHTRSLIEDGLLGNIGHLSLSFSKPEFLAGGRSDLVHPLLEDMSIHHFDLIRYLTGQNAVEVYAIAHRPNWSLFSGKPSLDAIITMEDGTVVNYRGTWAGRGQETPWDGDFVIHGERGVLSMFKGQFDFNVTANEGFPIPDLPSPIPSDLSPTSSDLQAVLHTFMASVGSGAPPETDIWDNRHTLSILFAAEESIRLRRPVKVLS